MYYLYRIFHDFILKPGIVNFNLGLDSSRLFFCYLLYPRSKVITFMNTIWTLTACEGGGYGVEQGGKQVSRPDCQEVGERGGDQTKDKSSYLPVRLKIRLRTLEDWGLRGLAAGRRQEAQQEYGGEGPL